MHATASTFAQDVRRDAERLVQQGTFDFLMPFGPGRDKLTPGEVALCMGRDVHFVYQELQRPETVLEVLKIPNRIRSEMRILRRSVLLWLALAALEGGLEAGLFMERVERLLESLRASQLERVIQTATRLKSRV